MRERIPGAQGQPHVTITGAGLFVEEDAGEETVIGQVSLRSSISQAWSSACHAIRRAA
jgi:hypothetical protein